MLKGKEINLEEHHHKLIHKDNLNKISVVSQIMRIYIQVPQHIENSNLSNKNPHSGHPDHNNPNLKLPVINNLLKLLMITSPQIISITYQHHFSKIMTLTKNKSCYKLKTLKKH